MNTILFYRILTVDFSAIFRSASLKQETKSNMNHYIKSVWQQSDNEAEKNVLKLAQD